ncbi:Predicted arabinose efflux permease, MFS family [Microlunatus sagamiharensis]|uniref:Predicted arabinose efflux permease, MFS family n=1 Tax=Microlunatus sagamiharensis TaxID=546874 RepID=A0A1H2LHF4_9ACTN|nr:MFS transporter [Microlunatus sagamiharensis]SDU80038.1 Predicted arabinose efflux permease, MFS family [Microlunatus sagamiharensis]
MRGRVRTAERLALLAAGLFVVGTNAFVIAGVLPSIAGELHAPQTAVASSITWYAAVVAIASPLVGVLLPWVPRTALIAVGLVLVAGGTVVAALAPGLLVFIAGRVLAAFGGAALVPTATAAAPAMLRPEQRGLALAATGLGFTLASAVGSPLGTALAALVGWRVTMLAIAGLALLLAVAVLLRLGPVPLGAATSLAARVGVLRDPRVSLVLLAAALVTTGFNVVYIFSARLTEGATGGDGRLLALLLLLYGAGGVVGTALAGPVTDRFGNRVTAAVATGALVAVFVLLAVEERSYVALAILFGVWGVVAFAAVVPLQHRLVGVDPSIAGLTLGWYSTAMYVGIAVAPLLGAAALAVGPVALPLAGAAATALALLAFQLGFRARRRQALGASSETSGTTSAMESSTRVGR